MNNSDIQENRIECLKKICVEKKIVSKRLKLNPRKDVMSDSACLHLSEYFQAPIRVAIDVLFQQDGITPTCKFCSGKLDLFDLPNYKPINYSHKSCASTAKTASVNWNGAVEKRKSTCMKKYGVEHFFDYDSMVVKSRKTKLDRYGCENYVNPEKAKKTKLDRYGCENYRNDKKISETCLEKYGSENPFGSLSVIDKSSKTLNDRYGGRGLGSPEISNSIKKTNLQTYGVENPMSNKEISKKSCDTKRRKYFGDEVFMQLTEDLPQLYKKYFENNNLSIAKLSKSLGIDRNTLSRSFVRDGFEILDRSYSCSTSSGEDYIFNLLMEIDPSLEIHRNVRSVISPKEIDLWIPKYNLGIEYHGSYWHQEERAKNLHYQKAAMAKERGIRLIQIFDFEIIEQTDKIQSLLRSSIGAFDLKIAARDCQSVLLSTSQARTFCEENHLQGYSGENLNYGLVHKQHGLVQLLSFGNPRFSKFHQWEIVRSCTKRDHVVLGGLEKLWVRFVRDNIVRSVIAYADARFFSGESYFKLGFNYTQHTSSGYFWSNGIQRLSRYKTQKKKLIENVNDINTSENDIMKSKGYYKILDAGNHVYEWKF